MTVVTQETMTSSSPLSGDVLTGEEIVISGISGLFPSSNNVFEFMDNLYNKVDMVTINDPAFDHAELPKFSGKVTGIHKFDAQFFRVPSKQADCMEPMSRKMMEHAYCAMFDAGVNPIQYKGKNIGVFTTEMYLECSQYMFKDEKQSPFLISGACSNMQANRISYWLDAKGPSYNVQSWSGSALCLNNAINCIKTGICDAAIVGAAEFTKDPALSINLRNAGLLCLDNETRCFDKDGDGYVRSQALGVFLLQKAKDAKRIYAELCKVGMEYSFKQGVEFNQKREPNQILDFLNKVYSEAGLFASDVEYIEAHGAAIPQADANELQAISEFFGKQKPVKVGCVKSNMGCAEPVSGICAITKLCLAYHKGKIAGNLHYNKPLNISAIKEGRIAVLTDNTPFNRGYTAVNNFSYTGTNCHIILKGHFKPKNTDRYKCDIPRLILVPSRNEKGAEKIFKILKDQPIDPELVGMLHDIYQIENPVLTCRGYIILDTENGQTVSLTESTALFQGFPRPLCLVFSGMGSQWPGMGTDLMRIPTFASAVEKCCKTLKPKGVDVLRILTSPDKTIFDSVLNAFVGIAAIQIGLVDILKAMGVVSDYIIGHSLGEMGCAYYDGCFSAEEMILIAYARGLVSIKTKLIKGSMAAVSLGYHDMLDLCPPEIDIACHNSAQFCTISGPEDIMKIFVAELKEKGVFAKEVPTGNIAYHSRYIQDAGPEFLKLLKEIIKTPVKRSRKWKTTSWPEEKWEEPEAQLSSAEYHANNLLSPVYFEETARLIPSNAVVVEVAPHGLMQAILKKSHPECTHIPLTRRGHPNALEFLFSAFGNLYKEGYNLKVDFLYPKIEYPVSTETPLLSHFIEWYHEEDWVPRACKSIRSDDKCVMPSRTLVVSTHDNDYKFLTGYLREGSVVFPEAAILFYTWETLAMYNEVNHQDLSVFFCDVHFLAEVLIDVEETVKLKFSINKGNNYFEVTRNDVMIANGSIYIIKQDLYITQLENAKKMGTEDKNKLLSSDDVYNTMNLKGHHYQNEFRSIQSCSPKWNSSQIRMTGNWITFIDSLIQLNILARNYDGVSIPKILKRLTINMIEHKKCGDLIAVGEGQNIFRADYSKINGVTKCGGITLRQIFFNDKPREESVPDVLFPSSVVTDFTGSIQGPLIGDYFSQKSKKNKITEYKLINTKRGQINSLKWVEKDADKSNTVKVYYAAPSMRDVQNVVGLVETKIDLGMDFSGVDKKGNRVMGLVAGGALASSVKPHQDLLWPVPEHWTLEEAATVPLPYIHAFYCLILRSSVQPRHSVFVNGGAGALGQAVISICLSLGCTVYTSVSNLQKKIFLMNLFSDLKEENIGYSLDDHFCTVVLHNTNDLRCDIVINCATGYLRELGMKCVSACGYFLDLSEYDMKQNKHFGMCYMMKCKSYITVNLSSIFRPENIDERKLLHQVMSDGIACGVVKPISYVVYSPEKIERAFRLLSLRRHLGRALIQLGQSGTLSTTSLTQRITYPSEGAYLVVCGDKVELGVQLINHLIERGARQFIFHQRSKKISGFLEAQFALWQSMGATVITSARNLQIETDCEEILKTEKNLKGLFVIQQKIHGSKDDSIEEANSVTLIVQNLNRSCRLHCRQLKYFVILAQIFENDKHTISMLENICKRRTDLGMPALILRAGLFNTEEQLSGIYSDMRPMTVYTVLKAMDISLMQNYSSAITYNIKKDKNEFLEKLSRIIGIENINNFDGNVNLKQFISNEITFEEMKSTIRDNYKVDLPQKYIEEMTIDSLRNLNKICTKLRINFNKKLAAFHDFVDCDEIRTTEIFVPMYTASSVAELPHDLHGKAVNLMIIPGFEGHYHTFKHLSERLKIRATTLQLGPDLPNESIQKIALDLKDRIKQRFVLQPQFYLLGYSFGINVALEIAALLEKDGLVGVIFCLDSSPDALRAQLDAYLGEMTEEQLQNAIIKHMFYVMSGRNSKILEEDIENFKHWTEKVDRCVEELKYFVTYSNQYKKAQIDSFYNRINLAQSYNPEFKLESNIVLLKGVLHPKAEHLPFDYGLSKYSKIPIKVFDINSDVVSAPYDSKVPDTVNQLLDPALLEDYKSKNHCECYSISRNNDLMMY